MLRWLAVVAVSICGCSSFDPAGSYEGTLAESGSNSRMTTDLQPDGTSTADTHRYNRSTNGAVITVRRFDERHLEIDLGNGCKVRVQHSPEPNDNSAIVPPTPDQTCRITVEGYAGDVTVGGNADFTKADPPELTLTLTGNASSGNPDRAGYLNVQHTWSFTGPRRAQ